MKMTRRPLLLLSIIIFHVLFTFNYLTEATNYPSPPVLTNGVKSRAEVYEYLKRLQKYYMIVGRPRL